MLCSYTVLLVIAWFIYRNLYVSSRYIHYEYSWYFQGISISHFLINIKLSWIHSKEYQSLILLPLKYSNIYLSNQYLGLLHIINCLHQFYCTIYCKWCQSKFQKLFSPLLFLWFYKIIHRLVSKAPTRGIL